MAKNKVEKNSTYEKWKKSQPNSIAKIISRGANNHTNWMKYSHVVWKQHDEQLLDVFASFTSQQSQVGSLFYLQRLCSDQEGETPLDMQLEADGESGDDKAVVPRIFSSSNRVDSSRKYLEFDKELFL